MDYLTVKEMAELKGCSERYIQRLVKNNKLTSEQVNNVYNNQPCYMIPVSSLPEDLQAKYYAKLKADSGLASELKDDKTALKQRSKRVQRSFEELSEEERRQISEWTEILKEWQGMRNSYSSKTEFDRLYVGKCQLEHPDLKISTDILYRKWRAYKNSDFEGLLDGRGAWNRGRSTIPEPVWDAFLWYWLDENKPTASLCYRSTVSWTEEFYPELADDIPSERAFRRQIERDISYALKTLMRDGEKAFDDRCRPYIMRMYDSLEANDCWIADNHTLDVISTDGTIKHRLYLTAFLDVKSGVLVGWNITDSPDSQSTTLALRHGILRFGISKIIYFDNMRTVRIYDENEKFLFEWQNADFLMLDFLEKNQQNIADAQEKIRTAKKFVKEQKKRISENLTPEQRVSMLGMTVQKAGENLEKFEIRMPKRIVPMIAHEEPAELKKAVGVEDYDFDYLEETRAMNNRLENERNLKNE